MAENEITIIPDESLPMLSDSSLLALADKAEKQIEAIKKIRSIVLKVTNNQDWIDQNGKPYLQSSGGEKVARIFGIGWRIDEPTIEYEPDGHFMYCYKGYFTLSGTTIEAIGTRSSKDGFFKKYGNNTDGERVSLPPTEIDKGDVKKSAYTNLIGNGVTRLLGIRNLTWEEVQAGGIVKAKTGSVDYKKKSEHAVNSDVSPKRQEHYAQIEKCLTVLFGDDQKAKDTKLIELTTWKNKEGKVIIGTQNYHAMKSDQTVAILCSKLVKIIEELKVGEMCSECRKPLIGGRCVSDGCVHSQNK